MWLEKAVASASLPGSHATDKQVARARLQLGVVYWQLGQSSQVTLFASRLPQACPHGAASTTAKALPRPTIDIVDSLWAVLTLRRASSGARRGAGSAIPLSCRLFKPLSVLMSWGPTVGQQAQLMHTQSLHKRSFQIKVLVKQCTNGNV